jgi:hypothetical protein
VPKSELVVVEQAGQLPFVEEQGRYLEVVRNLRGMPGISIRD